MLLYNSFYIYVSVAGSNLLMLRLLVQKGLPTEGLSLLTFNPDMIICPVHYVSCYFIFIVTSGNF